jgi:hypothetical protein
MAFHVAPKISGACANGQLLSFAIRDLKSKIYN